MRPRNPIDIFPEWHFNQYWGQYQREELVFNKLLNKNPDKEMGIYIDIGAGDYNLYSNTYYYYIRGWKGILIEPFNEYHSPIKKFRPRDILLPISITNYDGKTQMYMYATEGSVIGESYKNKEYKDKPNRWYTVDCMTIDTLIQKYPEYKEPDILSLDIETNEEKTLSKCNFNIFRPKLICIEKEVRGVDYRSKWEYYLLPYYELRDIIGGNAIYLRRNNDFKTK